MKESSLVFVDFRSLDLFTNSGNHRKYTIVKEDLENFM